MVGLRGAEAPLFHVTAHVSVFQVAARIADQVQFKVSGRGRPLYTLQGTHV
jgi:hypothetical protein